MSTPQAAPLGIVPILTVVFVVLKLTHFIDWSWWWVLSPLWISVLGSILFMAVIVTVALIRTFAKGR